MERQTVSSSPYFYRTQQKSLQKQASSMLRCLLYLEASSFCQAGFLAYTSLPAFAFSHILQWPSKADSIFTVTGSPKICTSFPFQAYSHTAHLTKYPMHILKIIYHILFVIARKFSVCVFSFLIFSQDFRTASFSPHSMAKVADGFSRNNGSKVFSKGIFPCPNAR